MLLAPRNKVEVVYFTFPRVIKERYSGTRQVLFGLAAAGITFGVGRWLGVSLSS